MPPIEEKETDQADHLTFLSLRHEPALIAHAGHCGVLFKDLVVAMTVIVSWVIHHRLDEEHPTGLDPAPAAGENFKSVPPKSMARIMENVGKCNPAWADWR